MAQHSAARHSINIWGDSDCSLVRFDIAGSSELELEDVFHEGAVILAFENCGFHARNGDGARTERPGDIIMRRAGEQFSIRAEWIAREGAVCREIHIPDHRLKELVGEEESPLARLDFGNGLLSDPVLARRLMALHARFEHAHSPLEAFEATAALLEELALRHAAPADAPRARHCPRGVGRVADYLREHVSENLSLDDLAHVAQMNRFVLLRQFREAIGMTPHQYQRIHRVLLAKLHLRSGMPLAEIATACGFADQSHLTREFKRRTGVTPSAFIPLAYGRQELAL